MTIPCYGRTYPESPRARTIGGSLERPPPYYFRLKFLAGGFTGLWSVLNNANSPWLPFTDWEAGVNTRVRWINAFGIAGDLTAIRLEKTLDGTGNMTLKAYLYKGSPVTGYYRAFSRTSSYLTAWPDLQFLRFLGDEVNWTFGGPSVLQLERGDYALLPADTCQSQ